MNTEEKLEQKTILLSVNIKLQTNPHDPERDKSILKTLDKEIHNKLNTFKASGDIESFTIKTKETMRTVKKSVKKRQKPFSV